MSDFAHFPNFKRFLKKKIMSLDLGSKYTGWALFTPGMDPWPLPQGKIPSRDQSRLLQEIKQLVQSHETDVLVLGLPYYTDGSESEMTKKVRFLGGQIQSLLPVHVEFYFQDETLTSFEAEDRMKNSPAYNFRVNPEEIDALAAAIILEDFIKA